MTLAVGVAVAESPQPLTFGIFLVDVEEGARIFEPIELLPFEHPVASGHQFPNPARFHTSQVERWSIWDAESVWRWRRYLSLRKRTARG